jgi:signal transduction histidine kinase
MKRLIPRVTAVTAAWLDVGLALVIGILVVSALWATPPHVLHLQTHKPDVLGVAAALLVALPFAFHRRRPYLCVLATGIGVTVLQAGKYVTPIDGSQLGLALGIVPFAVALSLALAVARTDVHKWRAAALTVGAGTVVAFAVDPGGRLDAAVAIAVFLLAAWAIGGLGAARRALQLQTEGRKAAAAREREANIRAARVSERARIARDLHDIVAHNVSLIVIESMAADRMLDRDLAKARELHVAIQQAGRDAVGELRLLLEVLRADEEETGDVAPHPTLDDLPNLIEATRGAGLTVDYTVTGTPRSLAAGSELAVYRMVQEALTNVVKHVGPTEVTVRIDWQPQRLSVSVMDAGANGGAPSEPSRSTPDAAANGYGLIGMRERISAIGGTLSTGAQPTAGFAVRADIPLTQK